MFCKAAICFQRQLTRFTIIWAIWYVHINRGQFLGILDFSTEEAVTGETFGF